jgi:hypothetical protein
MPPKHNFTKRKGYVGAEYGPNGWFCVFDRSEATEGWQAGRHQWLVRLMPDGPERTTRTRNEAVKLAKASATTMTGWNMWWKPSSSPVTSA